jgi:hypothetical protein
VRTSMVASLIMPSSITWIRITLMIVHFAEALFALEQRPQQGFGP